MTHEHARARIAEIAASIPAIDVRFERLTEFAGVRWIGPEPDEPFRDLTARLFAAFPECPPYGGRHPDSLPHLTVARFDTDAHDAAFAAGWPTRSNRSRP